MHRNPSPPGRPRLRRPSRLRATLRSRLALLVPCLLVGSVLTLGGAPADRAGAPRHEEPAAADFQQVTLAKGAPETGEPMTLAVLPDRSVLHTSRDGTVRLTDAGGATKVAGEIPVYSHDEEGLQGVGVDPDFTQNRFVYLFYAPPMNTPEGDAPETGNPDDFKPFEGVNRLSRFVLGEDGKLDMDSETKVLEVPVDRGLCCHVGGDIAFDADGNLLLSTGDDTNPFQSDGYAPIDERADRNPAFDAQRSSGNTNDLRGKILRIKVQEDGWLRHPRRQPLRAGHGEDPSRDLRDGLPQPIPHDGRQAHGHRLRRRLRPRRGLGRPGAGSRGAGRVRPRHRGGQLRLAVLHRRQRRLHRLRLRQRGVGGEVRLRRPEERLPEQHGPGRPAGRASGLAALRRRVRTRVRRRLRVPDGRPRLPLRRGPGLGREVPRRSSTGTSSPGSSAAAGSRASSRTTTAASPPSTTSPGTAPR